MKLTPWDTAKQLITREDALLYLQACLAEAADDNAFLASAIATVARSPAFLQSKELGELCSEISPLQHANSIEAVQRLIHALCPLQAK